MKPLLLTDLDDTLFQTARKMPPDAQKHVVANGADGQPLSFLHPWQQDFIHWALASMTVIPVTARGIASFQRVQLPFQAGAVCLHGGAILLPDGALDREWHAYIAGILQRSKVDLAAMLEHILQIGHELNLTLRGWLEQADTLAIYLVIKTKTAQYQDLELLWKHLPSSLDLQGVYQHMNGNNLALIPHGISKTLAAAEMIRRHYAQVGRVPTLGMGDSISDLGFMRLCDFAAFPPHSQLDRHIP